MSSETLAALAHFIPLVDEKVGIVRSVELLKISENDPAVYLAHAEPCDTMPLAAIRAANRGAACAASADRAILRACGESVERYCSAFFSLDDLLLASAHDLEACGLRCVPTAAFYPFARSQYDDEAFPFERASADSKIRWVTAQSASGEEVLVPASCVYVPYLFQSDVEPFTHMPISTGLAAGPSRESCVEKGICEIIERDALMIVWYARLPVPRINVAGSFGVSAEIDALLGSIRTGRTEWFLNWLTLDIDVPVISAMLIDRGDRPLTSFGIAAAPDPATALRGAIEEALLTRTLINRCDEVVRGARASVGELRTLRDHLLAHALSGELRSRMAFLTDDGPCIDFDDVCARSFVTPWEACNAAGLEPLSVEVTTGDVAEMEIRVVRTLIPGMQPLDNDHRFRYLGGERLRSVPKRFGCQLSPPDFNPDPHPFP